MKRIIAVSTFAVATLVGFSSAANAGNTSNHTGINPTVCAVGAVDGTLTPVTNTITGAGGFSASFPTVMSSTGSTGKFVTLCNVPLATLLITPGSVGVPAGQTGHTTTYTLTGAAAVYPTISGTYTTPATTSDPAVAHGLSVTPSEVTVSAAITAASGKVLVGSSVPNSYSVPFVATLTAN
jgi:hypothetical protein